MKTLAALNPASDQPTVPVGGFPGGSWVFIAVAVALVVLVALFAAWVPGQKKVRPGRRR